MRTANLLKFAKAYASPVSSIDTAEKMENSRSENLLDELKINLEGVPHGCEEGDIRDIFREVGRPAKVVLFKRRPDGKRDGYVILSPRPNKEPYMLRTELRIQNAQGKICVIRCTRGMTTTPKVSQVHTQQNTDSIEIDLNQVDIGVMKSEDEMMVLHSAKPLGDTPLKLVINTKFKSCDIHFDVELPHLAKVPDDREPSVGRAGSGQQGHGHKVSPAQYARTNANMEDSRRTSHNFSRGRDFSAFPNSRKFFERSTRELLSCSYRVSINFTQLSQLYQMGGHGTESSVVIPLTLPPLLYGQLNAEARQEYGPRHSRYNSKSWIRLTGIDALPSLDHTVTQLNRPEAIVDIGRWLTYRLVIGKVAAGHSIFQLMMRELFKHNVQLHTRCITRIAGISNHFSLGLDKPTNQLGSEPGSSLSDLEQMEASVQLDFHIRYALEVCLSQGVLHECNITPDFFKKLALMEQTESKCVAPGSNAHSTKATRLLEKAADLNQRIYNPMNLFNIQNKITERRNKMPRYCVMVRSVTITPTSMYLANPVLETSNRVLRHFIHHQDRFLRVRFTDEKYKGRIQPMGTSDNREEIFDRVARTMSNGINIAGRHYEFLAFGNSQFREHGAYFFAPTTGISAQDVRNWMGDFKSIRVIAKHASRIGQCFSTTRATSTGVVIEKIPDIMRNGFCFSDGVGKISTLLAHLIAADLKLPNSATDYPSVFQFRLGGCKGVLAVDPSIKGPIIKIRPSQEKFPAKYYGLEVCRVSQFSTAYLNMQIILVLSTLGVADIAFLTKLRTALADILLAMTDEDKAVVELTKNVDFNQTTITLASMVQDGFMSSKEPFMMACLHLWRSWTIKYIKEKAKIPVSDGAFVVGCVDEYGELNGHYNSAQTLFEFEESLASTDGSSERKDIATLPEIFLQIPDPEATGKYVVVQGICTLARNPSLSAGDIRVVRAVDRPKLRHLKNCVVLPQKGDRDLANMCSGGDLDGDDYLVMWDETLLPQEWNHEAMNYEAPDPVLSDGPVTVDDISAFFVSHMKNDELGRIAVAHRYWADLNPNGVKSEECKVLANLHSKAVDYAKTGVPATMPQDLRIHRWPHWAEPKNKTSSQIYHSTKILGQLYDDVQRVPFQPAWDSPFDERILNAYELSRELLDDAREIKLQYDEAIGRIMLQRQIASEFEVWSTFVLEHNHETSDYKFAELMGELVAAVKEDHREICYEKAGTNSKERDWAKMGPFIAAMYTATANDVAEAVKQATSVTGAGQEVVMNFANMPLMSFPWIFARELGLIATKKAHADAIMPRPIFNKAKPTKTLVDLLSDDFELEDLPEITIGSGVVRGGEELNLMHQDLANLDVQADDRTE
ncbi:putative RNA-dependent RNA polymerase, eukaryotic-type [Acrodontium crateriforme]|uniref:RNA-dependent RNA polymerase n=1 Tax=Acrodontium crateriforme TaxID=150365 RepID=A0AAQ3RAW7_9PEZI|nr:putative RNA-dependent RNA polymerase, eukaryotic-type [Acrodontium crateriforme]